jgi:hypothetical protein
MYADWLNGYLRRAPEGKDAEENEDVDEWSPSDDDSDEEIVPPDATDGLFTSLNRVEC